MKFVFKNKYYHWNPPAKTEYSLVKVQQALAQAQIPETLLNTSVLGIFSADQQQFLAIDQYFLDRIHPSSVWSVETVDSNIGQKIMHATGLLLFLQELFQSSLATSKWVVTRIAVTLDGFAVDIKTKLPLKKTFLEWIIDKVFNWLTHTSTAPPRHIHPLYQRVMSDSTNDYLRMDETVLTTDLVLLIPQQKVLHFPFWFTDYSRVWSINLLDVSAFRQENSFINRITGGGFASSEQATHFTAKLSTQQKINHRVLGKQMLLFTTDPSIGQGMIVWLPRGAWLVQRITAYIQAHNNQYHYQTVLTPVLGPKKLYETSGHLKYYRANMFPMLDTGDEQFFLRPMTCPHHIKVYQLLGVHSYRSLPVRIAEITQLYRYEASGALGGLERCRIFTLPDAHIFVSKTILANLITELCHEIMNFIADFHLTVDHITLAINDPTGQQTKYYPDPELWATTIAILHETIKQVVGEQLPIKILEDDAAFYGPKIDINVKNNDHKTVTLATLQVDFGLPRKFQLSYITAQQKKSIPFILHRGIIGSIERFIAILLEQTRGWLPLWLSQVTGWIIPVHSDYQSYAEQVVQTINKLGLRMEIPSTKKRINQHLLLARQYKIPYVIIVGADEARQQTIMVRNLATVEQQQMTIPAFLTVLKKRQAEKN